MKLLKLILTAVAVVATAGVVFRLKRKAKKTDNLPKEREQEVHNSPITRVENEGPTHINELTSVTPQVQEVPAPTDIVDTNETTLSYQHVTGRVRLLIKL